MVKKKTSSVPKNAYRQIVYSKMAEEKRDIAEEKLREKGVLVGKKGYSPSKLKKEYRKEKIKEGVDRLAKKIGAGLKKKVKSKRILRKTRATVRIPEYKAPSVLGDPNRFFKNEMEDAGNSMFFE